MKFEINITLAAREETLQTFDYYENIRIGLGDDFLRDLEERYTAICENPYAFSYTDEKNILRDTKLHDFPFLIIYKIQADNVIVLSVHNTHKKPPSF